MSIKSLLTGIFDAVRAKSHVNKKFRLTDKMPVFYAGDKDYINGSRYIPEGAEKLPRYFACEHSTPLIVDLTGIKIIGTRAFAGKINMLGLSNTDSLVDIGLDAFLDCTALRSIYLPPSLLSIGDAFEGCTALTDIYCAFPEGAVDGAPWGADTSITTIHYDYTGE